MTARRVLVMGEGEHELGPVPANADNESWPLDSERLPALPKMVHRLLGQPNGVRYFARPTGFRRRHIQRNLRSRTPVGLSGYGKRLLWAIRWAASERFDALVYVIDRDRKRPAETIQALHVGRGAAERNTPLPCAVGTAVEAFDAWFIADGSAVKAAGWNHAAVHPQPEKLDGKEGSGQHPKDVAAAIFGGVIGLGEKYAVVASHIDQARLEIACPKGYAPFADEVRRRIGDSDRRCLAGTFAVERTHGT